LDATTKHRLAAAARLAVTFGAGWLVVRNVDWINLAGFLHRADFTLLVLSSIPLAAQFATSVWRWQMIVNLLSGVFVPIALLAITLGRSQLIGQYLPSTIGSDVVRASLLVNRTGSAIAVRSVMCDRLVGLVIMVAMIVVTLPCFALFINHGAAFLALAALSLGCLALFILFIARIDLLARIPWMGKPAVRVATDLLQTFSRGRATFYVLLLSLAAQVFSALLVCALAQALAIPIAAWQCLLIVPPALLIASFPFSLGGWGVREGALATGFALAGMSSAGGVATSILFGLTGPIIGVIAEVAKPLARVGDRSTQKRSRFG
jgi:glycosyltransferase 2 family protein